MDTAPASQSPHSKAPAPQTPPGVCPLTTKQLVSKVLLFCEQVNGIEYYAYQKVFAFRIIESLLLNDGAVITALFARQSGKSKTLSSVALGIVIILPILAQAFPNDERLQPFVKGVLIGVYAPKQDLSGPIYLALRDQAHSEVCSAIMSDPEVNVRIVQSRGDSLAFSGGNGAWTSIIKASTASEQTMVEGATHHIVFIDEAQRVTQSKVNKEIKPMLAATHGTMVKIGTAWMSRGGFHSDIQFNIQEQERTGVRNHFQFDYEQVITEKRSLYNRQKRQFSQWQEHCKTCLIKDTDHSQCGQGVWRTRPADPFHLNYEKSLQDEIARMGGRDTEEFKMNFRLLWQESRTIAIAEEKFRRGALPGSELNVPKHFGLQYAGLDIAKDRDSTVLTIKEVDRSNPILIPGATDKDGTPAVFYNKYTLAMLELQGSFERVQYDALVAFLRDFNVVFMYADGTGMGDPVIERLQVLLPHITIEPFRFTTASKSDLFKFYLQEWDAHREFYPAGEQTIQTATYQRFEQQHLQLEREWNGSYLMCSAPEGEHDDYTCSGALATLATKQVITPVVEIDDGSAMYGRYSPRGAVMGPSNGHLATSRSLRYQRGRGR